MSYLTLGALVVVAFFVLSAVLRRGERVSMPGDRSAYSAEAASVESLIRAGRKIEAIKRLREETGLGLKEAKEEVERRQRQL
ncbi:MAG: ribosomal protein L7/L12 [Spirochaetaceae bacterium]|nr:ribosomal protein L7/L12 [Myxococcales bacterium]MCB9724248.1 ribosomal protein L7/L12 [Spirochaetaceae bacterium]HPG28016.1 ribosomal protein L7/L12 [Myxococcota bacterium]